MKFISSISLALAAQLSSAYLVSPPGTAAPGATNECSKWTEDTNGLTCDILVEYYGFTLAQFEEWVSEPLGLRKPDTKSLLCA